VPGWQHVNDLLGRQSAGDATVNAAVAQITIDGQIAVTDTPVAADVGLITIDGLAAGDATVLAAVAVISIDALEAIADTPVVAVTAQITIDGLPGTFAAINSATVFAVTAQITINGLVASVPSDVITGLSYDDHNTSYDGTIGYDGEFVPAPPPPPPPTQITLVTSAPFGQSAVYVLETRTKFGKRVAQLPYFNIQMEDMLNDAGELRVDLPVFHPNVSRLTVEEGVHELWLWRKGSLIFAGPLWQISGNASEKVIHLTANGLLSYFNFRRIDKTMTFPTTSNGPAIAGTLITMSQAKSFGNLHIIDKHTNGPALGFTVTYNFWERPNLLNEIQNLANNVVTGFDYSIDATTRQFRTYVPRRGNTIPTVLEYKSNLTDYSLPRAASTIVNNDAGLGPGDGEAMIVRVVSDAQSMTKYGLMEGEVETKNAKSGTQVETQARKDLNLRKASSTIPTLTMKGRDLPFIGTFSPGDSARIRIDNGYDQFDKVLRTTGYQLTVGTNDEESVNIYVEGGELV
jgi:hypothetical protein